MKKFIYYLVLFLPALVLGQSPDQNYVRTTVYKTPTTSALPASPPPQSGQVTITYFDGLGRPIQQNAHKQSSEGTDIITHIEYDQFGRQTKEFLPYVTTAANMNFRTDAPSRVISYYNTEYGDAYPFSEKQFENSPLNRVLRQGAPGEVWQLDQNHTINFQYSTNTTNEVKRFKATTSGMSNGVYNASLIQDNHYAPDQLYKTTVTDENGAKTEEFKDKEGRVVLKRAYNGVIKHDTYYVYDIYGNLTYVIPPKAVDLGTINSTVLNNLCYQYRYDSRNRLAEKKIPGRGEPTSSSTSGWEYIVYDKLDRVVATGPALTPFSDNPSQIGWLITKYDVHGRVAYTGWNVVSGTFNSTTRSNLQTSVNSMTNLYVTRQSGSIEGIDMDYANNSTQPVVTRVLTINYYDNYVYPNVLTSIPTSIENQSVTDKTKGLPTGSWVRVPTITGETLNEQTHTFYDSKARPIQVYQKNHLGGFTQTDTELDFIGNPLKTITTHKYNNSTIFMTTVTETFEYTNEGRLLEHKHSINNNPVAETLSYNEYYKLGQLKTKKVGKTSSTPLQTVDYKYNIRGWMTDINDVKTLGSDLFAFKISYNNYLGIVSGSPDLYNGNISETIWRTSSDNQMRGYRYDYDDLNRLENAYYKKYNMALYGMVNISNTNSYNEHLTYDKNGNIMSLLRTGDLDASDFTITTDQLDFYYDSGNRLLRVDDNSNHPAGFKDGAGDDNEYGYDIFGNMTRDDNKGISQITYNHLNLPKEILFSGIPMRKINYLYNALGKKVEKKITNNTTITMTTYLNGFHYENQALKFFGTSEGYVNYNALTGYNYVYNYTDHLGNVRLSYTSDMGITKILEQNHYYPFGLKHEKYGVTSYQYIDDEDYYIGGYNLASRYKRNEYQYKYNGKEFQDELNLNVYDYGARNYQPDLGRYFNVDPHAENYYSISPYAYVANNPIIYVDPDGRDIRLASEVVDGKTIITITVTGKLINESGKAYTAEQMQAYTDRLVSSISSAYTGSDGDVSWKGVANITMVSDDNPLGATDHAFRIVDQGKIPGAEGENGVLGRAPFGENVVYLSNHMLDRTQATEGTYAGTGKTDAGTGTLERTGPHELGHSGNLKHPTPGTMDGNLMHQTKQPNAGVKLTKDQILQMQKDYDAGKLNQGKQKIE